MATLEQLEREIKQLRDEIASGRLFVKHAERHRRGGGDPHGIIVEETDGSPSAKRVTKIKVANGDLTDHADGSVTIATGGAVGGAHALTDVNNTVSGRTAGDILIATAAATYAFAAVSGDATLASNGAVTVAATHAGSPHHDAVTLGADAGAVLGLTGQQIDLDTQTANTVFAGPTTGAAADPTFRALVSDDLPSTVVETTDANYVDLTDGGATTLHSHAGGSALTVQEEDGTPIDTAVTIIRVPNGSLTDNGAGDVSLAFGGGGDVATDAIWDAAGDLAVGTGANTAARLAISAPAANIVNVPAVINGETTLSYKSLMDATAPTTQAFGDAAAAGTGVMLARVTHKHAMPANPVTAHEADTTSVHEATSLGVTGVKQTLLLQGWQKTTTAGSAVGTSSERGTTTKHDIFSLAFDSATAESAYVHHPMPDNWDGGVVNFYAWWYCKTGYVATSSDGIALTLKATSYGDGDAIDAVFGTGVTVTDTGTANDQLRRTALSADLTIAGAGAGEFIHWVITRTVSDAADDWAADMELVAVVVEYGISALSA